MGDDLVADDRPLRRSGIYQQSFVQALRRRKVERLTLVRGLDAAQCLQLVSVDGRGRHARQHAERDRGRRGDRGRGRRLRRGARARTAPPSPPRRWRKDSEAFARFRTDRKGSLHKMEEVVWSLMETLARSAHDVIPLAPLKSHDEYTFVHSVNVSLLVLAQARSFGIQGPMLHAMGLPPSATTWAS